MRFSHHEITPTISKKQYNPASDGGEIGVKTLKERLITAHGILMLVAWPMLSFTAIFFAAWMKPALPNGQWFQVLDTAPSNVVLLSYMCLCSRFLSHTCSHSLNELS